MNPTTEQTAIIAQAKGISNLLINACAGSGKTTTLKLFAQKLPIKPALALAFNKRNAQDLAKAMPGHVACKTFNALGHYILGQHLGQLELDSRKSGRLIKDLGIQLTREQFFNLKTLFEATRLSGFITDGDPAIWGQRLTHEALIELAYENDIDPNSIPLYTVFGLLEESNREALEEGIIDFDDQIYLPLVFVPEPKWPSYSTILVDEAQDLSPGNQEALKRLSRCADPSLKYADGVKAPARPTRARIIAVGDRAQAIYGFRGADTRSMETLRSMFRMETMELSVSFRCAEAIVEQARKNLPSMKARENAPKGTFERLHDPVDLSYIPSECAVLCRNNAPLIALALRMFRAQRSVNFLGVNLSGQLKSILDKATDKKLRGKTTAAEALVRLEEFRRTKRAELEANNLTRLVGEHEDKCACVQALFEEGACATVNEAKTRIEELFTKSNSKLCFSTGHRSKGFEWDEVFWLDPWLLPSKFAIRANDAGDPEPLQQEMNLRYVIITRAREAVTLIDSSKIETSYE